MSDESPGWGDPGRGTPPPPARPALPAAAPPAAAPPATAPLAAASLAAAPAPAGWYPDPWSPAHHRYWDGSAWTDGAFPHGPADPWTNEEEGRDTAEYTVASAPTQPLPPTSEPVFMPGTALSAATERDQGPPPPPEWSAPSSYLTWTPPPRPGGWSPDPSPGEPASKPSRWGSGLGFVALVVGVMVVVGSLGTLGGYLAFRHRSASQPSAAGLPPTVVPTFPGPSATVPRDPSTAALDSLVLSQADVASTVVVQPLLGGDQVDGQPTLDLCNGTFPSESLRTARLQVGAFDAQATVVLSTEAVLYANPAATEQAFSELKSVASNCPSTSVPSPVGEPAEVTHFNAAPDGSWAAAPTGVTRQAYDFVSTDELGTTRHSVAVYLRRGRALMGVYFSDADSPQITVTGQNTIEKIAAVFAARLANLPASVVNG
ncbi:MAG: hypothetical protein QOE07_303 [Acidimicrobiaceae bacterium]|nr:hypothetical protein [Acidimicrobiaceae bacterium]